MKPLRRLMRHLKRQVWYYEIEQDNLEALLALDLTKEERGDASRRYLINFGKLTSTIEQLETIEAMIANAKPNVQREPWYPLERQSENQMRTQLGTS